MIILHPVRMSVCNSHTRDYAKGLSACVGQFFLKLFINEASRIDPENVIPYQSSTFKRAFDHSHIKNPKADSVSNISSSSSLSSISISTLNSSTICSKMDRTTSQQTVTMEEQNKNSDATLESTFNQSNAKQPDSNQFNYWFECSSLSSGKITIDLTLDKGNPEEQVKFLHLHDLKTKRLFFLWDDYKFNSDHICGCVGGCNYYSVFDYTSCLDQLKPDNFEFFDLEKSISRCNPHFGQSLFHPSLHIAQSQPIMFKSYPDESYDYNDILIQNQDMEKKMMHETGLSAPRPESVSINKSSASLSKSKLKQSKIRLSSSMSTLANRQSKNSEFDDYYTADEEDDDQNSVPKKPKSKRPRTSLKSLQSSRSSRSKQSYFSLGPLNTSDNSEHLTTDGTLRPHDNTDVKYSNVFDSEPKMDLNFDIKRPILDSSLPKYCYLKYLSRAYVHNWNQTSSYPFYDDFSEKNIFFCYRKKGIDFTNLVSTEYQTRSLGKIDSSSHELNEDESVIKRRINLKFKTFECYITPLSLTALTRFTDSLKLYQMNANSMISALQSKTITNSIAESFIEAISKTQVSLKIPEIRLFALQCGLAEGDKISNAFVSTLANPDEFITLSLLSICIYSIQTQLIDCQNRTNAIFMIDKIDSQFCRLYDPDNLKKILSQNDGRSEMDKTVKLSCISNENSKTSIDYNVGDSNLQCIIMQECALDRISIKAIKKINEDANDKLLNNRISICEFDIQNIWFSFPEPPTSPKGKRKIPFSRFDWNLLSSVSPAVISWMCASKDCISSIKQLFTTRTNSLNKTIACLLSGAHSNKDLLNSVISCQFYNFKKPASQHPLSSRSKSSKSSNKDSTAFEPSKFLQAYLDEPSYLIKNDPSCKLVNMMRNYFLFFSDQFKVELSLSDGNVKKLVNETLMAWAGDLAEDQSVAKPEHYQSMVVNLAQRNEFKTELVDGSRMRKITMSDDSMENEKSSDESSMTRPINRADIQNINKMFKPVLGYIGIDAPSGTLMDNLFKEFGSLLFGNLNIKSVQINILGSNGIKNALLKFDPELDNLFKVKTLAPKSLDADQKIITTILSFDDLIFSINVRQVIPEVVASKAEEAMAGEKKSMSMNNPLYANSVKIIGAKYYTKIDAGIQVNNLVQEVNMPLLRLAHQIYSIIADAVDLEREKNKLNGSISFSKDEHKSSYEKLLERKNSLRIQERNVHVKKDYFAIKDKSHVSFFGWFNIRKVNFKAAVGNLALNGQMKNFQSTVLMGRKIIGEFRIFFFTKNKVV
ncbi:hypothetical protein BpHYR1_010760 [Brachionus plicatilis]|uniref:Fragile site-associated protein C-terminal domain-containing protein n=1 Tax=Brachionus plicatilis TaxID=10195 RepID=A0A3M7P6S2_BRAPC|nr:hypothetical protein BpHYR1_010760 [Brachionus plicatilis]